MHDAAREFLYDESSASSVALLTIALVLAGVAHTPQSILLGEAGPFPLRGDNLPMAVLCAATFGLAAALPEAFERLALSRAGRLLSCGAALLGAACLAAVNPLIAQGVDMGTAVIPGHVGSVVTRVASALLMIEVAGLTVRRGFAWSACLICAALPAAAGIDLVTLLFSSTGVAVTYVALVIVAWALLKRMQRERKGERIEHGEQAVLVQNVQGHSFGMEVVLFGLYGLAGGMSSGQAHSMAVSGMAGEPTWPSFVSTFINDLGLVVGVVLVVVGTALLVSRGVSPMPLRCLALPAYTACLFLTPLFSPHSSGFLVPFLVSLTQALMYALLWMIPHVTRSRWPLRSYAAASCSFFGCSFVGMWMGGELLPNTGSGDAFMLTAVVLICAIFVLEVLPPLFHPSAGAGRAQLGTTPGALDGAGAEGGALGDASSAAGAGMGGMGGVGGAGGTGAGLPAGAGAANAAGRGQRAGDAPAADMATAAAAELATFDAAVEEASRRWGLTPRERAVLPGLARGRSMAHIAAELVVSKNTVHTHVRNIYAKADVHSQEQLMDAFEEVARELAGGGARA